MSECPLTSTSWTWIKLINARSSLFNIFIKFTLTHLSWRSPLKAFLNILAVNLITRPIETSNRSLGVTWITSLLLWINIFSISSTYHDFRNTVFLVEYKNHVNCLFNLYDQDNSPSKDNVNDGDLSSWDFSFNLASKSIRSDDHGFISL